MNGLLQQQRRRSIGTFYLIALIAVYCLQNFTNSIISSCSHLCLLLGSVAFSSGSAATSAVIHLLSPGEKLLSIDDVYGGTQRYFRKIVNPRMGIDVDFVDFNDSEAVVAKLLADADRTKLFWLETPTNPTLKVTDIERVSTMTKRFNANALLAVDNTFCSPYFQNPLEHGADIVVHSVTKYINGHSDVVMGVVCTNIEEVYTQLRFTQNGIGAVPSPFDCYLAHRGLKTLHLRMEAAARYVEKVMIVVACSSINSLIFAYLARLIPLYNEAMQMLLLCF